MKRAGKMEVVDFDIELHPMSCRLHWFVHVRAGLVGWWETNADVRSREDKTLSDVFAKIFPL